MKKIQLFAAQTIKDLQIEINQWLSDHKAVHIIETNITSLPKINVLSADDTTQGQYAFYLLYNPIEENEEESVMVASKQMPSELIDPLNGIVEVN